MYGLRSVTGGAQMSDQNPKLPPLVSDAPDGLDEHYQAIQEELRLASPEDLRLQLPNLVESIHELSREDSTVRFLIGVSFTHDFTPLDYRLERYRMVEDDPEPKVETIKEPVSASHSYLTVIYPPDPGFGADALRTVLLAAVERTRHTLETDPTTSMTGSRLLDLWEQL